MKKSLGLCAVCLVLFIFGCNAPETPKFGVVDVAKVIETAKASQKAKTEIEALVKAKQAELNKKAETLKTLEKSAKESKPKADEYNKTLAEYQKMAGLAESEVKNKANDLRKKVLDQVKQIVEGIGQEEKFVMIFIADTVPYYQAATDVTDKVIKKYDEAAGNAKAAAPPAQPAAPPAKPEPSENK